MGAVNRSHYGLQITYSVNISLLWRHNRLLSSDNGKLSHNTQLLAATPTTQQQFHNSTIYLYSRVWKSLIH